MECIGLDKYVLYKRSLYFIALKIFTVIHDFCVCLCLLNRTVLTGKNVSLASAICLSIISYVKLGFTFRLLLSISCKRDSARPSLHFEIAVSLTLFNVINVLFLVVLINVIQMLVRQGRWSEILLIITPDEVLMLCISSCSLGVLIYI